MSSRLPYYRMFPKDFDSDENVRLMTMCELGLYIRCLNHAWVNGSLPNDVTKIAKIVGEPLKNVKKSWPAVAKCFTENEKGTLENKRLENERKWATEKSAKAKQSAELRHSQEPVVAGVSEDANALLRARARAESESESESSPVFSVDGGVGETPCDTLTFLRKFKARRGFKNPHKPDREYAERRLTELKLTESQVDEILDGYEASDWGRKNGFPIRGVLKNPLSWIAPEPNAAIEEPAPQAMALAPATAPALNWESDPAYRDYLERRAKYGARMDPQECADGYPLFAQLTADQQAKSADDMEWIAKNASGPAFIPKPHNHLMKKPWLAYRLDVKPEWQLSKLEQEVRAGNEGARRILRERERIASL